MKKAIIAFGIFITASVAVGQICEAIAEKCFPYLGNEFISDGQVYRSLLNDDQVAEFTTTFFGGSTYRIAACSGMEEGNLIFEVFDQEDHLLYSSADYGNVTAWNFKPVSTSECRIEARLNPNNSSSGCAVVLIGFKQD